MPIGGLYGSAGVYLGVLVGLPAVGVGVGRISDSFACAWNPFPPTAFFLKETREVDLGERGSVGEGLGRVEGGETEVGV